MVIEIAVAVLAVAFAVLVGFLVPTLIQLRKTVMESKALVAHLNADLPAVVKEVRAVTENLSTMSDHARDAVQHASVFLHAVGEVGDSVHQAHKIVRGRSARVLVKLASLFAGVRAASSVVKEKVHRDAEAAVHQEGGSNDGKR